MNILKSSSKFFLILLLSYSILAPSPSVAEWSCGGFRFTSPEPVKLQDGQYVSTLKTVTNTGSCSRLNTATVTLNLIKQGKRLSATISPEGLQVSGKTPSCGGTGLFKTLKRSGRTRQELSVLATGASGSTPASFAIFYAEIKGTKTTCYHTFQ